MNNLNYTTIIFDYGGVLGSNADDPLFNILQRYGVVYNDFISFWGRYWPLMKLGEGDSRLIWDNLHRYFEGIPPLQDIKNEYESAITVDSEMLEYCRELKERGYKLGILANEVGDWMDIKRGIGKLDNLFDVVYSSADIGVSKPDPEAYKKTLESLKSTPEESIFIDNMDRNTIIAEKLGIQPLIFIDTAQCKEDLDYLLKNHT